MARTTEGPATLRVARTFPAPREKVFRAWIDPAAVRVWFAPPGASWTEPLLLDARPDGRYRWTVTVGTKVYTIYGTYREVKPPERLVFTWEWQNDPDRGESGESLITVEFFDRGGKTEVVLTQTGFPSEASRQDHAKGWEECLDAIGKLVS
jgi:uncharacterized protein YndB with AHSA1/START domain